MYIHRACLCVLCEIIHTCIIPYTISGTRRDTGRWFALQNKIRHCSPVGESFATANGGNQTIVMTNTGKSAVSFNMTVTPRGIGSVTGAPRTGQPSFPPPTSSQPP